MTAAAGGIQSPAWWPPKAKAILDFVGEKYPNFSYLAAAVVVDAVRHREVLSANQNLRAINLNSAQEP